MTQFKSSLQLCAKLALGFLLIAAASGCGSPVNNETGSFDTQVAADRAHDYRSIVDLASDAKIVAVGTVGSNARLNPYYGDEETPFAIAPFNVSEGIKGSASRGDSIDLSLEAGFDSAGNIHFTKLTPGTKYLLFLTPQGERSPTTYTVVGYKAGIYEAESSTKLNSTSVAASSLDTFIKIDDESPSLPGEISPVDVTSAISGR